MVRDKTGERGNTSRKLMDRTGAIPIRNVHTGESGGMIREAFGGLCALSLITMMLTCSAMAQVSAQSPYRPQRQSGTSARSTSSDRRTQTGTSAQARQRRPGTSTRSTSSVQRTQTATSAQARQRQTGARTASRSRGTGRAGGPGGRGGGAGSSVTGGEKGRFAAYKEHPVKYPKISDGGKKIVKLEAENLAINKFLQQLSLATGWSILPTKEVKGNVTGWLSNISVSDALKLLQIYGYYYEKKGNILFIMTLDEYFLREYGTMVKEEFTIKHASLSDVTTVLSSFQSEGGKMITDPRTGKLVVIDTKDNLKYMKEVVASLDVKLEPVTFRPKYALAMDLIQQIELMLSERGSAQVDVRTNMLTVMDVPERIERIRELIAELDVDLAKETFQVNFALPSDVRSMIDQVLPPESILTAVDERTRKISVRGVPESIEEARQIVEDFDKKLKQVSIQAYIMTANVQRVRELGLQWEYLEDPEGAIAAGFVPGDLGNVNFSVGSLLGGRSSIDSDHVSAVISALATDSDTEILANPRVLVDDGQMATFKNVTREPYQDSAYSTGYQGGGGETQPSYRYTVPMQVKFIDVGTTLDVTPRINESGYVEMNISAKDSTADMRSILSGGSTTTVPVETENSVITRVMVRSGETIVIGGLRVDSASKEVDKIPFLGDIPLIGHLFKSTERQTADRELLIFIRPEIVEEQDTAEAQLLQDFERDLRKEVLDSYLKPFDLGGDQRPLIRKRGLSVGENVDVPPFVPRYRRRRPDDEE